MTQLAKLRTVDVRPIIREGQPVLVLQDPLHLSDKVVVIPQQLVYLLVLCDGTRDTDELCAALHDQSGLNIDADTLGLVLKALDDALLLENDRYLQMRQQTLDQYRRAPFRPPALAGRSYPDDVQELEAFLDGYLQDAKQEMLGPGNGRGLISPHIDYARGGLVYAQVWGQAAEAVRSAELVILLGTDHYGDVGRITLTRQHYATPWGVLPTDQSVVDELVLALGEETLLGEELYHRSEHSIELATVWLHHMRRGEPCEMVPILCGSFAHFIDGATSPDQDAVVGRLVDTLRTVTQDRAAVVVAAADLAHIGPAFGGSPQGLSGRTQLAKVDNELLRRICVGDATGFFTAIEQEDDKYNVCGLSPIYLALRTLEPVQGDVVSYDCCPADERNTSWVSICGVVFD